MIYLNNAATSWPKPSCVSKAVHDSIVAFPSNANRGGYKEGILDQCRISLASKMGCDDPNRIVLCPNATVALNIIIFGLSLKRSDIVITTHAEHNSVLRPLNRLCQDAGIKVIHVPVTREGRVDIKQWEEMCERHRPRLAAFTHASNVTGAVNPVAEMAHIARKVGAINVMDASQTIGYIDVLPMEIGIDAVAFSGHKYLLGPQGTGGLWVRDGLELQPLLVGGTGIKSDEVEMPQELPLRLEAGTSNEPGFAGLLAALEWQNENPIELSIMDALMERLSNGLLAAGANPILVGVPRTPVLAFTIPGYDVDDIGFMLRESFDILCRTGLHCAPNITEDVLLDERGSVRVSLSRFTSEGDIDHLCKAVAEIVAS